MVDQSECQKLWSKQRVDKVNEPTNWSMEDRQKEANGPRGSRKKSDRIRIVDETDCCQGSIGEHRRDQRRLWSQEGLVVVNRRTIANQVD